MAKICKILLKRITMARGHNIVEAERSIIFLFKNPNFINLNNNNNNRYYNITIRDLKNV